MLTGTVNYRNSFTERTYNNLVSLTAWTVKPRYKCRDKVHCLQLNHLSDYSGLLCFLWLFFIISSKKQKLLQYFSCSLLHFFNVSSKDAIFSFTYFLMSKHFFAVFSIKNLLYINIILHAPWPSRT